MLLELGRGWPTWSDAGTMTRSASAASVRALLAVETEYSPGRLDVNRDLARPLGLIGPVRASRWELLPAGWTVSDSALSA